MAITAALQEQLKKIKKKTSKSDGEENDVATANQDDGSGGKSARKKRKFKSGVSNNNSGRNKSVVTKAPTNASTSGKKKLPSRSPSFIQNPVVEGFVKATIAKGVAGLRKDFSRNPRGYDMSKCIVFSRNGARNRYKDVGCLDEARVILEPTPTNPDGYIHANFVGTRTNSKRFICTQAPLDSTCAEFWSMVVQQRVETIVMLCNLMEKGAKKCAEYFPDKVGDTKTFEEYVVTKTDEKPFTFQAKTSVHVRESTMKISRNGTDYSCKHFHWVDWPDRGVPAADLSPIELLEKIKCTAKPIVVHCSAGIGRTGAIVLLQTILEQLAEKVPFDNIETLMLEMRKFRAASIQTDHQYLYVHSVLLRLFKSRGYLDASVEPFLEKFYSDYAKAVGTVG